MRPLVEVKLNLMPGVSGLGGLEALLAGHNAAVDSILPHPQDSSLFILSGVARSEAGLPAQPSIRASCSEVKIVAANGLIAFEKWYYRALTKNKKLSKNLSFRAFSL